MSKYLHRRHVTSIVLTLICMLIFSLATVYGQAETDKSPSPATSLPLLIDIGAKQCIPCKMMAPILDELKREYAGVPNVQFIDVMRCMRTLKPYGLGASIQFWTKLME